MSFFSDSVISLQEVRRRGLKVAIAGIPKTIDNDIPVLHSLMSTDTLSWFYRNT